MNFAQMLMMDVKPLPDTRPVKTETWKRNTAIANAKVTSTAKAKYMAAIGPEWVSSTTIADRLGTTTAAISKQLTKYEAKGFIERRPVGGRPFNNRTGYEWRVK